MAKPIDETIKEQVLLDIKNGMKVTEAAAKYGISDKSIYKWLGMQADNTGTSALEVARLRRENQELKQLVGLLTLEKSRGEKNKRRT